MSVYYVDLCDDDASNMYEHQFEHHVTAAHTFCNRCGVHILRAPNSHSNKLEINTNCLDDFKGVKDHKNSFVSINITYQEKKDWLAMGEGTPIQDNSRAKHADEEKMCDDEFSSLSIRNNDQVLSPWPAEAAYNKEFDSSMRWKHSELTPATTSIVSMTTSDTESTSDGLSCDENGASPLNVDISRSDSLSISGWPVGSSLQSLTPRSHDAIRTTPQSSSGSKVKARPSAMMKDQVKYFMRKHMASPSRLQHGEDMTRNQTLR